MLNHELHNFTNIFYINKVTQLLSVGIIWSVGLKQSHLTSFFNLIKGMEDYACHASLIVLIRSIYIEKLEATVLCRTQCLLSLPQIKKLLGIAITIQRFQYPNICLIVKAMIACSIRCRTACIDHGNLVLYTEIPNSLGESQVIFIQEIKISFSSC